MSDIVTDLRAAHALYAEAGVDGAEGARMMQAAADEIERLRGVLKAMDKLPTAEFESLWAMIEEALGGYQEPSKDAVSEDEKVLGIDKFRTLRLFRNGDPENVSGAVSGDEAGGCSNKIKDDAAK